MPPDPLKKLVAFSHSGLLPQILDRTLHLDMICRLPFSYHVKFYSFMFMNKIPTLSVCVNGKHSL